MPSGKELDPYLVLGLERGCSTKEIRDAYLKKSRKHHPDHGGDEWAFKIVVRAYESFKQILERERLASKAKEVPNAGRIRAGVHDSKLDPARIVFVEIVWMRYEVGDLMQLISEKGDDRNLSGSLNLSWPSEEFADQAAQLANAEKILKALNAAFDELRQRTHPVDARSVIQEGRFQASLGYANGQAASEAFKLLHIGLKARGLGARQWTRDVLIPRETAR